MPVPATHCMVQYMLRQNWATSCTAHCHCPSPAKPDGTCNIRAKRNKRGVAACCLPSCNCILQQLSGQSNWAGCCEHVAMHTHGLETWSAPSKGYCKQSQPASKASIVQPMRSAKCHAAAEGMPNTAEWRSCSDTSIMQYRSRRPLGRK